MPRADYEADFVTWAGMNRMVLLPPTHRAYAEKIGKPVSVVDRRLREWQRRGWVRHARVYGKQGAWELTALGQLRYENRRDTI